LDRDLVKDLVMDLDLDLDLGLDALLWILLLLLLLLLTVEELDSSNGWRFVSRRMESFSLKEGSHGAMYRMDASVLDRDKFDFPEAGCSGREDPVDVVFLFLEMATMAVILFSFLRELLGCRL
jgi:hypothetical protein